MNTERHADWVNRMHGVSRAVRTSRAILLGGLLFAAALQTSCESSDADEGDGGTGGSGATGGTGGEPQPRGPSEGICGSSSPVSCPPENRCGQVCEDERRVTYSFFSFSPYGEGCACYWKQGERCELGCDYATGKCLTGSAGGVGGEGGVGGNGGSAPYPLADETCQAGSSPL